MSGAEPIFLLCMCTAWSTVEPWSKTSIPRHPSNTNKYGVSDAVKHLWFGKVFENSGSLLLLQMPVPQASSWLCWAPGRREVEVAFHAMLESTAFQVYRRITLSSSLWASLPLNSRLEHWATCCRLPNGQVFGI